MSFSIAEDELRQAAGAGHGRRLRGVGLLPVVDRPENREFVRKFKARYGSDRVTSDVIEAAYNSVLAVGAGRRRGRDRRSRRRAQGDPAAELECAGGDHVGGRETQHTWRPVYIGRIRGDGQFDLVWSSEKPVRPIPYPTSRSRAGWEAFLEELYRVWGGWANPGPRRGRAAPRPSRRQPGRPAAAQGPGPGRPPATRARRRGGRSDPDHGRGASKRSPPRSRCRSVPTGGNLPDSFMFANGARLLPTHQAGGFRRGNFGEVRPAMTLPRFLQALWPRTRISTHCCSGSCASR